MEKENLVLCAILHFFESDEVTYQDKPEGVFKAETEEQFEETIAGMLELWTLIDSSHSNYKIIKEEEHWNVYATTVATGVERRYARWDWEYR